VRQAGAEAIVIECDMGRSAADWKVYAVRVSGISLVATYRSAFAEEVRNPGIDGLIRTLAAENRSANKESTRT
jgi:phospholipid transport system substrate-binding protein